MRRKNAPPPISFDYAIKTVLRDKANTGVLEGFLSARNLFKENISMETTARITGRRGGEE